MARGYGEGTWRKLASGNWQLTISAGTNREGERVRISGTGKTKKKPENEPIKSWINFRDSTNPK